MIKLTIITITYNSEKTLENTILSVINQKYEDLEYIIIDGGSTDKTMDIISKYKKNISYYISEQDKGISDAFNKGLRVATGDVVGIINSDDTFDESCFKKIILTFKSKNIDYLYADLMIQNLDGSILKIMKGYKLGTFPYGGMPFGHPTLFVKRHVYNEIGFFNLNYKVAMDFELITRMIGSYKGYYLEENLAFYSRGGMSDNNFINGHKEVFAATIVSKNTNIMKAFFYFLIRILRTILRKILEKYILKRA